ncbi:MAG: hypothetical protein U0457_07575 [Candidatus Sericytochromatia bacterium]
MSDKNSLSSFWDSYNKDNSKDSKPVVKKAKQAEVKASDNSPVEVPLPSPEKKSEPKQEVKEEVKAQETAKSNDVKMTKAKDFPLEKIKENLNPELKEVVKKLETKVSKEEIKELVTNMEKNKDVIFQNNGVNVFENLSLSDSSNLAKKLDEWNVPKEASELNASVILAWLNKNKK